MRRALIVVGLAAAVGALSAQQPALKSGIEIGNVDTSVRPQDDFYRHVNGVWLTRTEIPADKAGAFAELADKAEADVRAIIEAAASGGNRPAGSVAQQVGDLFTSFMSEARVEQLGATAIKAELEKIDAITTVQGMAAEAGALSAINAGGPVNAGIASDKKDPTRTILYLAQGGIALPDRDYYLQDDQKFVDVRRKYQEFLEKVFTLAGRPNAPADAKAVLGLETELAKIQWTRVESRDSLKTYNKFPFESLAREMPGFDWMAWARPQGLDRAVDVVVSEPSFFKGLGTLVTATPLGTWKAWPAAHIDRVRPT
jgi:predicted metalloendopeptidase